MYIKDIDNAQDFTKFTKQLDLITPITANIEK